MMQIGIVRMLMSNRLVAMPVRMWLGYRFIVFVPVVFVMHMAVIMRQNIVLVVMLMTPSKRPLAASLAQLPHDVPHVNGILFRIVLRGHRP